jgi:hypothetical protein
VEVGLARGGRPPGIDHDEPRPLGTREPVKDARPHHGLRLGNVVADQEERVAGVEVFLRTRLPVRAEGLLEGIARGRSAEAGVAVEVRSSDPAAYDERLGVVVLEEELPRRVEAQREGAFLGEQPARPLGDRGHGLAPVSGV